MEKRKGLMAMTRIMLMARVMESSLRPGATMKRISGSAKIMMRILPTRQNSAMILRMLLLSSQADFLLPVVRRWLKTGMKVTARAPETRMKNMKSGIVKAAV